MTPTATDDAVGAIRWESPPEGGFFYAMRARQEGRIWALSRHCREPESGGGTKR